MFTRNLTKFRKRSTFNTSYVIEKLTIIIISIGIWRLVVATLKKEKWLKW